MRAWLLAFVVAAASLSGQALAQTTTIGTFAGSDAVSSLGTSGVRILGESFVSPGSTLFNFSVYVTNTSGGNAAFVIAPLNGSTIGASIYSTSRALTVGTITFSNINASVNYGQTYIAYFTTYGVANPTVVADFRGNNAYASGEVVYGTTTANPVGTDVTPFQGDFAFTATFATPEPASWAMMIAGFGVIGSAMRRRRLAVLA